MSPVTPRRPGRFTSMTAPTMALVAILGVVAALGLVASLGLTDLFRPPPPPPSNEGLVAVPTPAARIPAYTRVRRDHLWDARNGRLATLFLPPATVTQEMLVDVGDIIGRVLESDKEPGYVFTESDFLPRGTREGLVAGIPAGKRAIRVAADKVDGLYGLNPGDRFDILATLPIENTGGARQFGLAGPYSQEMALQAQLSNWNKQATVRVIVQSAAIVEPMNTRAIPTFQSSLTEAGATRTRPVQEAVVAVEPDEVALLTEAMTVGATLTAIPRSGRPDDPPDSRTPDLYPVSPFVAPGSVEGGTDARLPPGSGSSLTVVETIMGQKRTLTAVPRP
jgi:Flp pilus assembly protein CpaB